MLCNAVVIRYSASGKAATEDRKTMPWSFPGGDLLVYVWEACYSRYCVTPSIIVGIFIIKVGVISLWSCIGDVFGEALRGTSFYFI